MTRIIKTMPRKAKSKNPKKSNIVNIKEVKKQNKSPVNITLDKGPDGQYITALDHYRARDLERMLTIEDCCILARKYMSKRSFVRWRGINKDLPREEKIGPEYTVLGQRIYRIKVIWILRFIKGLKWEPELSAPVSATQSNEMTLRSTKSL